MLELAEFGQEILISITAPKRHTENRFGFRLYRLFKQIPLVYRIDVFGQP